MMPEDEFQASPCRGVCRLGSDQVCDGCGRTIREIAGWLTMSSAERAEVRARVREWVVRGTMEGGQ